MGLVVLTLSWARDGLEGTGLRLFARESLEGMGTGSGLLGRARASLFSFSWRGRRLGVLTAVSFRVGSISSHLTAKDQGRSRRHSPELAQLAGTQHSRRFTATHVA
jgi:hypothetical protein